MITVVHVRRSSFQQGRADCIYGGRTFAEFYDEGWSNPYHEGSDGTREEVIAKFRDMVDRSPKLRARIEKELKGENLMIGCWCKPLACHCDILAELANR
jgi:hypothetical protein